MWSSTRATVERITAAPGASLTCRSDHVLRAVIADIDDPINSHLLGHVSHGAARHHRHERETRCQGSQRIPVGRQDHGGIRGRSDPRQCSVEVEHHARTGRTREPAHRGPVVEEIPRGQLRAFGWDLAFSRDLLTAYNVPPSSARTARATRFAASRTL